MIKNRSAWSDSIVVCVSGSALLLTSLSYAAPMYIDMNERSLSIIERKYGKPARKRVNKWTKSLNKLSQRRLSDKRLMNYANDYFNRVEWKWDIDHWGQEDYWATPVETLATNGGDCEDFSIGKYFSLINTGVDTSKLRITYVKALEYNLAHMVLAYYPTPNAEPLILDNINKTILPASKRHDLLPIYGFNGEGIWLAKSAKKLGDNPARNLPSWGRLSNRIMLELRQ